MDFSWKLGRAFIGIVLTLSKLSLFFLPGIVLIWVFRSSVVGLAAGITYLVLITLVGTFYRPAEASAQRVRVNATWLTFFPLSWSQDTDFATILADFTASYDDLGLLKRSADSDLVREALWGILARLERNMKWTRECVAKARKLRRLQRRLKDPRSAADVDARIAKVQERLRHNLELFQRAKTEVGQVNLALDEQQCLVDQLNPIEDEIVLLEEFRKALKSPPRSPRRVRTSHA